MHQNFRIWGGGTDQHIQIWGGYTSTFRNLGGGRIIRRNDVGSVYPPPLKFLAASLSLHSAGWCHFFYDFELRTVSGLLLIWTPSLTCLVRQCLKDAVTLAEQSASTPWCFSTLCFFMNNTLFLVYRLPTCLLPLVQRWKKWRILVSRIPVGY